MSLDHAIRLTEMLLALAFLQQSIEHIHALWDERRLFLMRGGLSLLLLTGAYSGWVCLALIGNTLFLLKRFRGPYNGGSDRMGALILCCLCLAEFTPARLREVAFGYLALQLTLSYFIAGWVKIRNPEWRSGRALQDLFLFSAYPVSGELRGLADRPRLLWKASWAVMLLELLFPFALLNHWVLILALVATAGFHFANACLFGLNRFFWIWLAAYPSILWLQERVFL